VSAVREGVAGATRTCPHCRATILESEVVCPACRHHLRAGRGTARQPRATLTPFRVEGVVRPPEGDDANEYTVVVTSHDERGVEVSRQVVGIGVMRQGESRSFTVEVLVYVTAKPAANSQLSSI
jgi:hypothetical protein